MSAELGLETWYILLQLLLLAVFWLYPYDTSIAHHSQGEYTEIINEKHRNRLIFSSTVVKIGLNMYTAILRRVLSTYTIILRRVNRMKIFIFVFVYIRRLGSLVAQGIGGLDRSCFGTRNRNDNRNGVGTTVPVLVSKTGTILRVES